MEVRVSRQDLFGEAAQEPRGPDLRPPSFDLEEIVVESPGAADADDFGALSLFGGQELAVGDLNEVDEEHTTSRPLSYYFCQFTDADKARFAHAAVCGADIIEFAADAHQAAAKKLETARDVNADYKKPKRPCRPGMQARQRRRQRNIVNAREMKAQKARMAFQRKRGGFTGARGRPRGTQFRT